MKQQSLLSLWGAKPKARKATAGGKENARKQQRVAQQSTPAAAPAPAEPPRAPLDRGPGARGPIRRRPPRRHRAQPATNRPGRAAAAPAPVEPPAVGPAPAEPPQPQQAPEQLTERPAGAEGIDRSSGAWRARPTQCSARGRPRPWRGRRSSCPRTTAVAVRARAPRPHRAQRGVHAVPGSAAASRARRRRSGAARRGRARRAPAGPARRSPRLAGTPAPGDAPDGNGGGETTGRRRRRLRRPSAVAPYLAPAGAVDVSGEDATTSRTTSSSGSTRSPRSAPRRRGRPGRPRRRLLRPRGAAPLASFKAHGGWIGGCGFIGADKLTRRATTASCASGTALLLKRDADQGRRGAARARHLAPGCRGATAATAPDESS